MRFRRLLVLTICLLLTLACLGQQAGRVFLDRPSGTLHQTFYSTGSQDGWVVEAYELDDKPSGFGAQVDDASTSIRIGDENGYAPLQIRAILSFDTSPLPDTAIITSASLVLKQQSSIIGGGNPFDKFGGLLIDLKLGPFGAPGLEAKDFQSIPDVGPMGPYSRQLADSYTFALSRGSYPYINKWWLYDGLTQLRLRFRVDSDLDGAPDYIHFYSGDDPTPAYRPQLLIEYHLPTSIRQD